MTIAAIAETDLESLFAAQRAAFGRDPAPDASTRKARLQTLADLLKANEGAIVEAISADFGHRPANETRLLELFFSLEGIRYARDHVDAWMRPERRDVSLWFLPARGRVQYQPLGVVGVIVPWNYPLYLAAGPLTAALAAGDRAMLKLSEHGPAFGALFARLIAEAFPADLVTVVNGDAEVGKAFSALPFDHLLFTGSTEVGKHVMAAAARNLTPVTLELGGKSPAIVAPDYDLAAAARKIAYGKLVNAGQTCVAPDYVLLPRASVRPFVEELRKAAGAFYGTAASEDYASIAYDRHYERLQGLIADARAQGGELVELMPLGDAAGRKLAPLALLEPKEGMRAMQEEIFGPLLPLVPYDTLDEAVAYVNARPHPLALYLFDQNAGRVRRLLEKTASGGVTVNDCMLHVGQDALPFGGVGPSGMGRYHGPEGFKTFSQVRSVFEQSPLSAVPFLHPPYGNPLIQRLVAFMLR